MHKAKVFMSGNSQAVRLPKEFQMDGEEVYIQKIGKSIILNPVSNPWASMRNSLSQFSDDLFADGREQPDMQEREEF